MKHGETNMLKMKVECLIYEHVMTKCYMQRTLPKSCCWNWWKVAELVLVTNKIW